ncbi:MAG: hypothetical protein HS099_05360 [Ardenticatenaceae bacterium]|nr:hypothetical protein [Ardenticatenaceae bacterium]
MINNVRDGQPLTANIDPTEVGKAAAIGAVSGAVAGATFGAGVAAGGAIAAAAGISSASGAAATAVGAATVAVSGAAAGQTGRATANLLTGQPVSEGLFQPQDMAIDAATSMVGFKAFGGNFNEVAWSNVTQPGSFARGSIAATGPNATANQRATVQGLGPCHHCGTSNPGGNGNSISDHIPPNALANGASQRLFPQCWPCMQQQSQYLRWGNISPLVKPSRLPYGTYHATVPSSASASSEIGH